ncbi:MAG: flagellar basal body L-ring protein FlgH [Paracoccus sp. (in: a-proteobacteria)]|nr:flagellar basal body L-ring protein FlgH [Paracoccus sp. (in: a-proteobacteria)]
MFQRVFLLPAAIALIVAGCARTDHLGRPPSLTEPRETTEFAAMTSPIPDAPAGPQRPEQAASLWAGQRQSLVSDRRAAARGDILTVVIQIDDRAEMTNTSSRGRGGSDNLRIQSLAGLPQRSGTPMDPAVQISSSSQHRGTGQTARRERMTLRVAATIIETLPNGVLHIQGTQEVRVNFELRELTVSGFVRPEDIGRNNEIAYDRIAGARISYGGRGQISDMQQPRYGQQVADMILPY